MPVEFLTDDEAVAYGRYAGVPGAGDLDRVLSLTTIDLALVGRHCGEHMRAGFALQLLTVPWLESLAAHVSCRRLTCVYDARQWLAYRSGPQAGPLFSPHSPQLRSARRYRLGRLRARLA